MAGTVIRELTAADLDSAFTLSSTAGWNQRLEDWRMLWRLAPHGTFAALVDDRVVGTAIGIDYAAFGWIAMMLVDPAFRGRGLGAQLLEAAIAAIPSGSPIRLDATPLGRPLYERYGFIQETPLTRLVAQSSERFSPNAHSLPHISDTALPEILTEDVLIFGADRKSVLKWSVTDAPYARMARDGTVVAGYCFGRRGRLFDQVGPIVAADEDVARALVSSAIADVPDRPVVIDAYDATPSFGEWLGTIGFRPERPLFRMSRPAAAIQRRSRLREFAIFGPDFG